MSREIDDPLRLMFRKKAEEMKIEKWDVSKYQRTPGDTHFLFLHDADGVEKVLLYNINSHLPKEVCFDEVADYYEYFIKRFPEFLEEANKFWGI